MPDLPDPGLASAVEDVVGSTGFSGVVRVDRAGSTVLDAAFGLADRRHAVPMSTSTRLGTASGTKGLTALTVLSLVADGSLALDQPVREVLGTDLPLVDDRVTVEHLLTHRSGIGDYFDEEVETDVTDHVLTVPVHTLVTTEDYLPALEGRPQVFEPGQRVVYNNSAFVVLALVAGRVGGRRFEELVGERVCGPAGMTSTGFLRGDDLPGDAATGYPWADRDRTNVLHLPVVGSGDGGAYTTTADVAAMWTSLFAGRILPVGMVKDLVRLRSTDEPGQGYGLGVEVGWDEGVVGLTGSDAGVSFRSIHRRRSQVTWTVISNTSEGAWPVARVLGALLGEPPQA